MRIVYNAESIIDAHLYKHALEDAGIRCHVSGEFLSGGIGELPAGNIVAVAVDEEQWEQARKIVLQVSEKLQNNEYAVDENYVDDAAATDSPGA